MKHVTQKLPNLASFFLRIGLAAVFIPHGWQKLQDMDQFIGFIGQLGLPSVFAYIVVVLEFVGGILLVAGLFTSWIAWALAFQMIVVILYVKQGTPFIGGVEFEYALMFQSIALALFGAGKYSLDEKMADNEPTDEKDDKDDQE